ncbi:MAG: fluoride efflux transporter CrcB [Alphaproteobacteria bacterium]|nr:fluoride efflux transporter CrcB [Alphaproteobacteria bacterium]MBT4016571.1 fluoride efflux transporter CrcB [Alphaproteobacteria bacterium]MBT4965818.1 fluoride efflux transporter CrcB [Alphaproteobacteria bacterium]MBT5161201.1 fluoride efflux transporter CrcB [Alphaproteobacteria bacterium]MBT5920225.1 fluoride efflux transporter CrcB [Alphaproteobacteria bacterium]
MKLVLAIAAGGALGAVARHQVSATVMRLAGAGFPWGTVAVNVLGSFLMGALIELMALRLNVGLEMRAFLTVGFLGAFTTFSTFSLDFVTLFERDAGVAAIGYAALSVILAIGALFAGLAVTRLLLT